MSAGIITLVNRDPLKARNCVVLLSLYYATCLCSSGPPALLLLALERGSVGLTSLTTLRSSVEKRTPSSKRAPTNNVAVRPSEVHLISSWWVIRTMETSFGVRVEAGRRVRKVKVKLLELKPIGKTHHHLLKSVRNDSHYTLAR